MATYKLLISDKQVKLGQDVNLQSLSIDFARPRELQFVAPKTTVLRPNLPVLLYADDVLRFDGVIVDRQPDQKLANSNVWVALGRDELAKDVQVNAQRNTAAATELGAFFSRWRYEPLSEFLDLAEEAFAEELTALGLCKNGRVFSGIRSGPLPRFNCPSGGFDTMLTTALAGLPGYRWMWRPDTKTFHISNCYAAPEQILTLPDTKIEALSVSESIRNCYSRVTLIGPWVTLPKRTHALLTPAWDPALEADWTLDAISYLSDMPEGEGVEYDDPLSDVFRKWSFESIKDRVLPDFPVDVLQFVPADVSDLTAGRWISVQVSRIDFANGYIWTKLPALLAPVRKAWIKRNAMIPGKSKQAVGMRFSFMADFDFPPPFIVTERGGRAYRDYGLQRELVIRDLDVPEVTQERADNILRSVQDPVLTGSIPVWGDVPGWAWNLDARISVRAAKAKTNLENAAAQIVGLTHTFAGGGKTDISVGNDRGDFGRTTA